DRVGVVQVVACASNEAMIVRIDVLNEYQRSAEETVVALATDTASGLTTAEARTRLAQFGPNELAAERPLPAWKRFARQFNDVRVIESTSLKMAEAALTGESLPVSKEVDAIVDEVALGDRTNMIYAGTSATYGRGRGVVVATGMRTEMGRIAAMLAQVPAEQTRLQKE